MRGHGFGHGVGVSQYGAYGYALHGKGYRFILAHYYRGTTIGQGERRHGSSASCSTSLRGDVGFSGATSACGGRSTRPAATRRIGTAGGSSCAALAASRLPTAARKLRAAGHGRITIAGSGTYRGALEAVPTESDAGALNAVNALPLEQYVKGVIANESPPSWPRGRVADAGGRVALLRPHGRRRRQRLRPLRRHPQPGLQGPRPARRAATNAAAEATKGQVVDVRRQNRRDLLLGLLGRADGERPERLLRPARCPTWTGVADPYDYYCPLHNWTLRFSGPEISAKLGAYLRAG